MRGHFDSQPMIIAYINLEKRVPPGHPLRKIKPMADKELKRLSPLFNEMNSHTGRPSIPPERILKSLLLIALYSVRSERQFCGGGVQFVADGQTDVPVGESMSHGGKNSPYSRSLGSKRSPTQLNCHLFLSENPF